VRQIADDVPLLGDLVSAILQAEDSFNNAKENLERAKGDIDNYLMTLGRKLAETGEQQLPISVARRLYWEYPQVKVSSIGLALGVRGHEVHKLVGGSYQPRCYDCDRTYVVEGQRTSRRKLKIKGPAGVCPECKEKRREKYEADSQAWAEREKVIQAQRRERLLRGDYWIDVYGEVILPEGELRGCPCGGDRRIVDDPNAWRSGAGVRYVCTDPACGDGETPPLAVYIPVRVKPSPLVPEGSAYVVSGTVRRKVPRP
jgi:hypothetical protein